MDNERRESRQENRPTFSYTVNRVGSDDAQRRQQGAVMAIGGAEDKERNADVLRTFVELAGGKGARVAVIPSASAEPDEMADTYREAFAALGVNDIRIVHISERDEADSDNVIDQLSDTTGIFMSGGDQSRLADLICGSRLAECLSTRNQDGAVLGGTSAGAAILASHMVTGGEGGSTPYKGMSDVSEGLGILNNLIVDTHFGERGRTGRLLAMHARFPEVIAIGLDEDTAAVIDADMLMTVVGSGAVTVIDGTSIRSDLELIGDEDPMMTSGIEMHTVTSRYTFDLRARKFVPPLNACYGPGE
jgi:cyanophycinase